MQVQVQTLKKRIIIALCIALFGIDVADIVDSPKVHALGCAKLGVVSSVRNDVVYSPPLVEHIFFHPLIAYPQRAFVGDRQSKEMFDWFVTVPEFKRIIKSLYDHNYVLVHLDDVYEFKKINGKQQAMRHDFHLPAGKKPLVISIDDPNYYTYMRRYGTVDKLRLNRDGKVVSESYDLKGNTVLSSELDIVPLLDHFVEEHPDFSYRGAKGTLALTGFEGILGWRTQSTSRDMSRERVGARKVVEKLKESGWRFASHSYGHRHHLKMNLERLKADERKWKREVGSLVGDTSVYIYPYGEGYALGDKRLAWLEQQGYTVFSHVGNVTYEHRLANKVMQDRRHIDGIVLSRQRELFLDLFDVRQVIDLEGRFPLNKMPDTRKNTKTTISDTE
ncbi:polysaccharide deacetylase family protein [Paenibacillus sp. 481]|uniref:polysaccharide deacetylase family protein n=1 Tax=Paenibacillus sp. 481 TaxID=2835869 RepID=UPI001E45B96F|nr:polysaccharide deacetylase family protein [Paenibacillus sp. 481]UHA73489.1 hypothetical protein KIK04_23530 [Paenibacillus sp. 481]